MKKSRKLKREERKEKKKRIKLKIKKLNLKEQEKNQDKHSEHKKYRSFIKNHFEELEHCIKENADPSELAKVVSKTQKTIDQASQKGAIHKNRANHKKSRLYEIYNNHKLAVKESAKL